MSRFVTFFCAVVAAISGLFLYNKKQQTTALDHQIAQIVEQTEHVRSQTAMLRAEWAMLNQPDRLGTLASRYDRGLQPVTPTQFVQMSALASHMPAPGSPMHRPAPAPRATMVATLAADHVAVPTPHDMTQHVAPPLPASPAAPHVDHVAAAPRHSEPAAQHDALARALAQNEVRTPVAHPPVVEHVHAPERPVAVAAAEPTHAAAVHDSIVSPTRMGVGSYHAHSQNIAEAAWHPVAAPVHMGGSSLGTPHVSALPPPVPVSN
ncbi:cell division protein FtsL [Komagataeibacter oboediens]|uniref:ABC transporter permease n=1 Tax=Komagataeibacter oboediens TaxID=65958 RepID=A0ABS5SNA6_9PROT|nr:ABC transporter permease [Komagataeibacter oboediens]MBL7233498.1 ABC transporter permease [Komagataeibacter oboediens]MBT0675668.1 ABC transporter permease [Komagataeibacter oboediens]MBT0678325.1 ABC transporter permease [Komagataeibacter oboediens]